MKKIVSLIMIVVLCLSLTGCKSNDYKTAVSMKDSRDYSGAAAAFAALGDYKNSAKLLAECNTMLAAIDTFEKAAAELEEKNNALDEAVSAAGSLVHSENKALDESLRPALETAISFAKAEKIDVPDRPNSVEEMNAVSDKMSKANYSSVLENLDESQNILQESMDRYALVNAPSEAYVISCLKKVPGITGISAATEDDDPNGQLGKAGGYTAAVFFSHENVKLDPEIYGYTIIEQGTDAGGQIEVYATEADAERRNDYLATYDGTILASGSHTVIGTCVVRTSNEMKASQQKDLEAELIEVLTSLD